LLDDLRALVEFAQAGSIAGDEDDRLFGHHPLLTEIGGAAGIAGKSLGNTIVAPHPKSHPRHFHYSVQRA
jgi:hypothetical protein